MTAPEIIIGCDPDTRLPSFATVQEGRLVQVWQDSSPYSQQGLPGHGVIEDQFIAAGKFTADIINLAHAAGACASRFQTHEFVRESTWKRGAKKSLYQRLIWERALSSDEREVVTACCRGRKTVMNEVMDAVGIALWRAGRGL